MLLSLSLPHYTLAPHAPDLTLRRMLCQDGPVYRHRSLSGKSSFYFIHFSLSVAIIIRIFFRNTHFSLFQIKRTCTDNFEVNFFMVNHACMTEVITTEWQCNAEEEEKMTRLLLQGHRHGHMCFCEEDECNSSTKPTLSHFLALLLISAFYVFFRWPITDGSSVINDG